MENQKGFKISQYACAVMLIVSSIALVANDINAIDGVRLSPHFRLGEFLNLNKYPENIPTMQVVAKGGRCPQFPAPHRPGCRHPSKGPCAVPDARGVLQEMGVLRPAADG